METTQVIVIPPAKLGPNEVVQVISNDELHHVVAPDNGNREKAPVDMKDEGKAKNKRKKQKKQQKKKKKKQEKEKEQEENRLMTASRSFFARIRDRLKVNVCPVSKDTMISVLFKPTRHNNSHQEGIDGHRMGRDNASLTSLSRRRLLLLLQASPIHLR